MITIHPDTVRRAADRGLGIVAIGNIGVTYRPGDKLRGPDWGDRVLFSAAAVTAHLNAADGNLVVAATVMERVSNA